MILDILWKNMETLNTRERWSALSGIPRTLGRPSVAARFKCRLRCALLEALPSMENQIQVEASWGHGVQLAFLFVQTSYKVSLLQIDLLKKFKVCQRQPNMLEAQTWESSSCQVHISSYFSLGRNLLHIPMWPPSPVVRPLDHQSPGFRSKCHKEDKDLLGPTFSLRPCGASEGTEIIYSGQGWTRSGIPSLLWGVSHYEYQHAPTSEEAIEAHHEWSESDMLGGWNLYH